MVALLVLGRRSVLDRRVESGRVVPVHPGGGFPFQLGPTGEGRCWSINSDLYSPTADSINALSKASPTLPIDPAIPASRSASVNAIDVY